MPYVIVQTYIAFFTFIGTGPLWVWPDNSFPMAVVIASSANDYVPQVAVSVDFWNALAGCEILTLDVNTLGATVIVEVDDELLNDQYLGLTFHNNNMTIANIRLRSGLSLADKVIQHELGHVFGLRHNEVRGTLMFKFVSPGPQHVMKDEIDYIKGLCP